jgi:hypothetical protein
MSTRYSGPGSFALLWILGACSGDPASGAGGPTSGGSPIGDGGSPAAAGSNNAAGGGNAPAGGAVAGSSPGGGNAPVSGSGGTSAGTPSGGAAGASGGPGDMDPQAPRPINVVPGDNTNLSFDGQSLSLNKSKPARGKLVLLLGGICTGTGAGGFESFVKQYGFHVFAPKTDTCLTGGSVPEQYKQTIETTPDDAEANRQVSDARMELWDGVDRVDWYEHSPAESIVKQTQDALSYAQEQDPGGDWAWFLNPDGSLRTTDVYVVGYSWGSQSWAMISSFVRFGRVICTSGPVAEGFPSGGWITKPGPNATPGDRKYILVDLKMPYPSEGEGNMEKFANVIKAGWDDDVTSVTPDGAGTYTATQHLFAMIGSNNTSPGGHTVFCNDNPQNGWLPVCKHVMGVE